MEPTRYPARKAFSRTSWYGVSRPVFYAKGNYQKREVLTLERRQPDLDAGTLRLEPGTTKNDQGRVESLTPTLRSLLGEQVERVRT